MSWWPGAEPAADGAVPAGSDKSKDEFEVYEEGWPVLQLFFALGNAWNTAGVDGERVGLDRYAIDFTARTMGVELTAERLDWLTAMETEALGIWREKAKRERERERNRRR